MMTTLDLRLACRKPDGSGLTVCGFWGRGRWRDGRRVAAPGPPLRILFASGSCQGEQLRRGFTLVELLIAMSLSVLVGGVLYLLQSTGLSTVSKGTTRLTLQSEARRNLEQLAQDLRCARDILSIKSNGVRLMRYVPTADGEITGNEVLQTVEYRVEKDENQAVLVRQVEKGDTRQMIKVNHIEPEMFVPYYDDGEGRLREFDMKENDSGQRKRIALVVIQLRLRQGKEVLALRTAVALRSVVQRLFQPNWKYR